MRSALSLEKQRSVLIVGAGIAGPVVAYFLHRFGGGKPVVVERAADLRATGQTIDLRGAGKEVARRMGIVDAVREKITQEDGLAFVDATNTVRAAFPTESFSGAGFVSEIEILRGELVKVLYEQSRSNTEYIFGDYPTALSDQRDHVEVTFASGNKRNFDLVIGADGIRSKTRRLAFSGDNPTPIRYLNMYTAYFTIPYAETDKRWARWYNATGGRTVLLRPDNQGTTRAYLSIRSFERGYEDLSVNEQKQYLWKTFGDAGFEVERVLSGMQSANDFYFEAIGQVKMEKWSQGRVSLLGDAAYCASPISGMGTSLALVGAYILAGELGRHPEDYTEAFKQYEALMRPYVTKAQKLPPGAMTCASPQTSTGIALQTAVLSIAARPAVTRLIARFMGTSTADDMSLPNYEDLVMCEKAAAPPLINS
jgi:2-polyprenyl-6-methoxyphenol hydroxylase-like FAD-dependent oxidoreductase